MSKTRLFAEREYIAALALVPFIVEIKRGQSLTPADFDPIACACDVMEALARQRHEEDKPEAEEPDIPVVDEPAVVPVDKPVDETPSVNTPGDVGTPDEPSEVETNDPAD